jgi:hypothetical protein
MPKPRLASAVAKATGAADKNPQRFRDRKEPKVAALGEPPEWMVCENELSAWHGFKQEMPWLAESDRTLVEVAARLRGRMIRDPDMGVNALAQLRLCLQAMGGTPSDRSKVGAPDEESDDPADQFFN